MVRKLSKGCFSGQRFSDFIQVYRRLMITLHNIALCKEGITMTPEEKARINKDLSRFLKRTIHRLIFVSQKTIFCI